MSSRRPCACLDCIRRNAPDPDPIFPLLVFLVAALVVILVLSVLAANGAIG